VESKPHDKATTSVAREAAIATTLSHRNVVSTYSHDIAGVSGHGGQELDIYRFYLIQVSCTLSVQSHDSDKRGCRGAACALHVMLAHAPGLQ
jgi:hypothetical protein